MYDSCSRTRSLTDTLLPLFFPHMVFKVLMRSLTLFSLFSCGFFEGLGSGVRAMGEFIMGFPLYIDLFGRLFEGEC